ncbi:MAG: glycine--tRNA ligase subunit beta [Anaerolineae bacterium]|nr:glycine--tRNA ligase subunit beta [Anaerolineae bacterium]
MTEAMNFQNIILELQKFWGENGCLIWQPYYTQVGAGTYNPATFLRVLGPEPWNVAYVEPSIRPDDGRYGDNPNRLQQHYQFQVILKPDPGNPVELYLNSLKAIGIDPREHDIRFVEDNWTSPALGAWGLGWEVWLDGQEITQFTYFQQSGGFVVDPVAVEITYGLERIAIALQRVKSFRDIAWDNHRTYGDVNLQGEREHSTYYFEVADVERVRQMYDLFEAEANNSLTHGLVLPAHDNVLKCSHTFNILDARGAVGVTERQAMFSRMRDLSRRVAEAYLQQREGLGFPWSVNPAEAPNQPEIEDEMETDDAADFILEIGTEELPVEDLDSAMDQVRTLAGAMLADLRLQYDTFDVFGTPRRVVLSVRYLATRQADQTSLVKGPPARAAFDAEGKPTRAAAGFAQSKGIPVESLSAREMDGGVYAVAEVFEKGQAAADILPAALTRLLDSIKFTRSMRWNQSQKSFSRPIRWLLALHGCSLVRFRFAGLFSDRISRGLRFTAHESYTVSDPQDYFTITASQGIILDPAQRKQAILSQVQALLADLNATTNLEDSLVDEVTNLVEQPTAILGRFSEEHLTLPSEVLISVMKKHQRYFPVFDDAGNMMNYFITIRNGNQEHAEVVIDGNEQVIKARFADATFFIREDRKKDLESYLPDLEKLTFQLKLGSMLDKTHRIEKLVNDLAAIIPGAAQKAEAIHRAAHLCKADLATQMVVEMTSLQGIMGRYYADLSGEPDDVSQAIYEHYLPRYTGDKSPSSMAGLVIGLADRLDSISGLFAAGLAPSGAKDPFAQRRTAIGLIQSLITWNLDLDLVAAVECALRHQPVSCSPEDKASILEFFQARLKNYLLELNYRYDIVDAVLARQSMNPAGAARAAVQLTSWVNRTDWNGILPAFSRCVRITRGLSQQFSLDMSALETTEETTLAEAVNDTAQLLQGNTDVDRFLEAFTPMVPLVNAFFDAVLVMDENQRLRENRLALLQKISAFADSCADLSCLEGF